jgi:hypothetical protein
MERHKYRKKDQKNIDRHTNNGTGRQRDTKTDIYTFRHTEMETGRLSKRQAGGETKREKDKSTFRKKKKETDRLAKRQVDGEIKREKDEYI